MAVRFQNGKAIGMSRAKQEDNAMLLRFIQEAGRARAKLMEVVNMKGAITEPVEAKVRETIAMIDRDIRDWRSEMS